MYCFDSRVRYSESDREGTITLPSILDYFQDGSSFHSEDMGVGIEFLAQHRKAWVLNSWQIEISRYARYGEQIQISTWPYAFKGFLGYRNFTMTDSSGELLACANTIWTFLDTDQMRPVRILPELEQAYKLSSGLPMRKVSRKISLPEEMETREPFPVHKYHIDTNQHVNNSRYVSMAQEYLPEGFAIGKLRVEYRKAAVYGDTIYPFVGKKAGAIIVNLANRENDPFAIIELEEQK